MNTALADGRPAATERKQRGEILAQFSLRSEGSDNETTSLSLWL